jgi:hypothetical protein
MCQEMLPFAPPDTPKAAGLPTTPLRPRSFARAVAQDPGFARAHAGLSFTRFQDALLSYADPGPATAVSTMRR